jgi:hypothetical protein
MDAEWEAAQRAHAEYERVQREMAERQAAAGRTAEGNE